MIIQYDLFFPAGPNATISKVFDEPCIPQINQILLPAFGMRFVVTKIQRPLDNIKDDETPELIVAAEPKFTFSHEATPKKCSEMQGELILKGWKDMAYGGNVWKWLKWK